MGCLTSDTVVSRPCHSAPKVADHMPRPIVVQLDTSSDSHAIRLIQRARTAVIVR